MRLLAVHKLDDEGENLLAFGICGFGVGQKKGQLMEIFADLKIRRTRFSIRPRDAGRFFRKCGSGAEFFLKANVGIPQQIRQLCDGFAVILPRNGGDRGSRPVPAENAGSDPANDDGTRKPS